MADATLTELGNRSRAASKEIALANGAEKNEALELGAAALMARLDEIVEKNTLDVASATKDGVSSTALDRLRLSEQKVLQMADSLRAVAALSDPVGEVVNGWRLSNGLLVRRVRVPLGVIGVIYENRPNVTSDAAALCLKSGNAVLLRGSSSAINSNMAITEALRSGIQKAGLSPDCVLLVKDTSRESVVDFVELRGVIDCLVPRGGAELVALVRERALVPYVIDGDGNCHIYVDASADLDMAERIVVNAKTQRPSVCNAMESLLVHKDVAPTFLPRLSRSLSSVDLVGDEESRAILPEIGEASDADFAREFLDLRLSVAVVSDLDEALSHIARYSTGHSEAIITNDHASASRFVAEVDSAAVLVNASTRFVDGSELGLGAEIGISTQKLHARGPMGLAELTSVKYVIEGSGQVRE